MVLILYGIKNYGTEKQCYKTIRQRLYATSNSTWEKWKQLRQQTYLKTKNRRSVYAIWNCHDKRTLKKKSGWKTKQVSTTCFRDKRKATGIWNYSRDCDDGALGGCLKKTIRNVLKILSTLEIVIQTVPEMQRTILLKSETVTSNIRTSPNGKTSTING